MKPCPFCAEEIQDAATVCKHCGKELATATTGKNAAVGCFSLIAVVVVLSVAVGFCSSSNEPKSAAQLQEEREEERLRDAPYMCRQFVEKRLRSPSSAQFPRVDASDVRVDSGKYIVNSYVDSQNAFGAMLRTPFRCVVMPAAGDTWSLIELEME